MINSFFSKKRYFTFLILFLVIGGGVAGYFIMSTLYRASSNYAQNQRLENVINSVNKSTIASKEFLLNSYTDEQFYKSGSNKNTIAFDSNYTLALHELTQFLNEKNEGGESIEFKELVPTLESYQATFKEMTSLYQQKGFKDVGVEGAMRKAVHEIENAPFLPSLTPLLSLRRHEKDFILRKDLAYVDKYTKEWEKLVNEYQATTALSPEQKEFFVQKLNEYKGSFFQIVEIEQKIGLTERTGFRKEIVVKQNTLEADLLHIKNALAQQTEASLQILKVVVWAVSSLLLLFFVLLTVLFVLFNDYVRKPVIRLREAAEAVSGGNLSIDISDLKKYSLLKELTMSIEQIIYKFRDTIAKVGNISKSGERVEVEIHSEKDEVGKALVAIATQLDLMRKQEGQRAWHNEGLAMFAEIVREQNEVRAFSERTIKGLVQFLKVNQAGLFILTEEETGESFLELTAAYAYERKKFVEKKIPLGEGLVGQCFMEGESIYMTDVPQNYVHITSGLGEATPRCLFLLACKAKNRVEAVLELASFEPLSEYQRDFLEKVGESIASALYFIRVNEKTSHLMLDFKQQTEHLKMQEEEMRQNLEELNATQEEMQRREKGLKERIAWLEKKIDQDSSVSFCA
jgi:hypothetical protein